MENSSASFLQDANRRFLPEVQSALGQREDLLCVFHEVPAVLHVSTRDHRVTVSVETHHLGGHVVSIPYRRSDRVATQLDPTTGSYAVSDARLVADAIQRVIDETRKQEEISRRVQQILRR